MRRLVVLILLVFAGVGPALAADPSERLADPKLEARAEALSEELRCLVCQNQSIEASNAQLARDLRIIVRQRIVAGDSDAAIKDFLVERYGEFVLLKPRFSGAGLVLWLLPALLVVLAGLAVFATMRRRGGEPAQLTAEEEARLERLIDQAGRDGDA